MNNTIRKKILTILKKNNPKPTSELKFNSGFELLIATVLSSKTTDKNVNIATKKLFNIANTPSKILSLDINKIKNCIKNVGFYNIKSKNIIKISRILIDKYNGNIPNKRIFLELLPGVGRKTTNIVLNTIFGFSTIAIDTHVFRVSNRTGFVKENNIKLLEKKLIKLIPKEFKKNFHNWFMLHGKNICTAKKPLCNSCIIKNFCESKNLF